MKGSCPYETAAHLKRLMTELGVQSVRAEVQGRPAIVQVGVSNPITVNPPPANPGYWLTAEFIADENNLEVKSTWKCTPAMQELINQVEWSNADRYILTPDPNRRESTVKILIRSRTSVANGDVIEIERVIQVPTDASGGELIDFLSGRMDGDILIKGGVPDDAKPDIIIVRDPSGNLKIHGDDPPAVGEP